MEFYIVFECSTSSSLFYSYVTQNFEFLPFLKNTHLPFMYADYVLFVSTFCFYSEQAGRPACPLDPYFIIPDKCTCVDFQTFKLQELNESVPQGEMPRHLQIYVDRCVLFYCYSFNFIFHSLIKYMTNFSGIYAIWSFLETKSSSKESTRLKNIPEVQGLVIKKYCLRYLCANRNDVLILESR